MKAALLVIACAALSGCVTSLNDIKGREVQDDIVTKQALPAVRDCLLATLGTTGRTPLATGNDQQANVMFSTGETGVIFHYTLTAADGGTRVEARRKNNIADGFNSGRACYP